MGRRGPVAKPLELRVLEGNRGNRAPDLTSMFRPEVSAPSIPRDISREGRKAWRRLVPELLHYNLLAKIHADGLEELCETIGLIKVLRKSINKRQELLIAEGKDPAEAIEGSTPNGMRVQSVTYQALNREREKLRGWLGEFGLTPAQQARVTTAVRVQASLFDVNAGAGAAKPAAQNGFADFE